MKTNKPGFLCVIEGIDGSGKTTLLQHLVQALRSLEYDVVQTREPGGTILGKEIREWLHTSSERPIPESEFLLFAADRAQHIHELVKPALNKGKIVVSDRMADSSMAYQGYGRGIDRSMIASVNRWVMQGIEPDLVIYIGIDWDTAFQRLHKGRDALTAFEQEKRDFFERIAQGFSEMFKDRSHVIMLDGRQEPHTVFEQALAHVLKKLEG